MNRRSLVPPLMMLLAAMGCYKLFLAVLAPRELRAEQGQASPGSSVLSCTPERPTVWPREVIRVRVWVAEAGRPLHYTWTATGGRVEGQGPEARWDFADVQPGPYTATVTISGAKDLSNSCSAQVIVLEREGGRGRAHELGKALLEGDKPEAEGYGLYSYLLFATPPDDSSRERYKKAIEAYLRLIPDIVSLEKYLTPDKLNITYLPVDGEPPKSVSVEWVLQHYNYARALVLLRALPGAHRDGPYFVSSLAPLTWKPTLPDKYLFQDLSSVPPDLVALWVNGFMNQAAQERFWEENTAERLTLKLRTAIGILAIGLPKVQNALSDWIAWRQLVTHS